MKLLLLRKFEMSERVYCLANWYVRSLVWKLRRNRGKLISFAFLDVLIRLFYNCYVRLNNNPCDNSISE